MAFLNARSRASPEYPEARRQLGETSLNRGTATDVGRLITELGERVQRMGPGSFAVAVALVVLLKVPVGFVGVGVDRSAEALPAAWNYASSSILPSIVYRYVLIGSGDAWEKLSKALSLAVLLLPVLVYYVQSGQASRSSGSVSWKLFVTLMAGSSIVGTATSGIGHYTSFFLLFATLCVVVRNEASALGLVATAVLSHPEVSVVAFSALLVLTRSPDYRHFRRRAAWGVLLGLAATLTTSIWVHLTASTNATRAELLTQFGDGLLLTWQGGMTRIFSWYGAGWALVALAIAVASRQCRWAMIVGLVLIPGLATLLTTDGTRVAASASCAAFTAVAVVTARSLMNTGNHGRAGQVSRANLLGLSTFLFLLTPNLVDLHGQQWAQLVEWLHGYF